MKAKTPMIQTPQVAECLLDTDLNDLPMLDGDNFRIQFAKNVELYLDTHLHLPYGVESALRGEVEKAAYSKELSFAGDSNFCNFTAHDKIEFYLKFLRRIASLDYFRGLIADCFDKKITPEQELLNNAIKALHKKYPKGTVEHQKHEEAISNMFFLLIDYENKCNQLLNQLTAFELNCFDFDTAAYLQNVSKLGFPLQIELLRCKNTEVLIFGIE